MSDTPAPVEVTNVDPMPVVVSAVEPTQAQATARSTAAQAQTDADILRTEDQRRISGIWERTQQVIALSVVLITLLVGAWLALTDLDDSSAFTLLASLANLVIGFYFGRTNHTRVGGVGEGPHER